ncbi:DNA repair protein rad50 [Blastocladiella emersonii ATCC 22665]|nr:DNA repair protein rad50 [Blastocladiella emersonii ATCC 22665]
MSSIEKLLIRGIRSFDPQSSSVIEFYSPLTLIIVECLKYATTGEMPPNSRQGAFIHDPKLANESEVKAQVKLKFRNTNGKQLVSTRSLQVTQRAKTATFKTLEGVLEARDPVTGERATISARCSDMDAEMIHNLGVSKAILESVIFVHQEESNWPLAEPAVLKKKFDDIFASTRYTKALENLRTVKKEKEAELKTERVLLQSKNERMSRAFELRKSREATANRIAEATNRIAELNTSITDISKQLQGLVEHVARGQTLDNKLSSLLQAREQQDVYMAAMSSKMALITDKSDDELLASLDAFKAEMAKQSQSQDHLTAKREALVAKGNQARAKLQAKLTEKGTVAAELAQFERLVAQRRTLIDALVKDLNMDPAARPSDERFATSLRSELAAAQLKLKQRRDEADAEQAVLQARFRDADSKLAVQRSKLAAAQAALHAASAKYHELTTTLTRLSRENVDVASIHTQLQAAKSQLDAARAAVDQHARLGDEERIRSEIERLDRQANALNNELGAVTADANKRAKLTAREADLATKSDAVRDAWNALARVAAEHGVTLPMSASGHGGGGAGGLASPLMSLGYSAGGASSSSGSSDSPVAIEASIAAQLNGKKAQRETLSRRVSDENRKRLDYETQLRVQDAERARLQREIETEVRKLARVVQVDENEAVAQRVEIDLDAEIRTATATVDELQGAVKMLQSVDLVVLKMIDASFQDGCCALCLRAVETDEDEDAVRGAKDRLTSNLVARTATAQASLDEAAAQLAFLQKGRPHAIAVAQLRAQLAALSRAPMQRELESATAAHDAAQRELRDLEAQIAGLDACAVSVRDLARVHGEYETLDRAVQQLRSDLTFAPGKSVETIQADVRDVQEQRERATQELHAEQEKARELHRAVATHQGTVSRLQQNLVDKQGVLAQRDAAHAALEQLKVDKDRYEADQANAEAEVRELADRARDAQADLAQRKALDEAALAQLAAAQDELKSRAEQFFVVAEQLRVVHDRDPQAALGRLDAQVAQLHGEVDEAARGVGELDEQVQEMQRAVAEVRDHERNISDNLAYREMQRERSKMDAQAAALQREIAALEQHQYTDRVHRLKRLQTDAMREASVLEGERGQLEANLVGIDAELAGPYANADAEYKEVRVQVKTSEMAVADLEKYGKALDTAIMKYHTLKMDAINKLIRELWVNTYQGNDIDTIEIRADKESRGMRQYAYRVVMLKGDAEIEMRGRCSAGQKVLASLVIRLALAETFCLNCGILALDEPTTNLDHDNVEALAEALARIVKLRRQQVNFQLVVITHDEEFMQLLGRSEFCDFYWRVSKDENRHSVIERQAIRATG